MVTYSWRATVGNRRVASGAGKGTVAPGDKLLSLLQFKAPLVTTDTDGRIEMTATVNGRTDETLQDSFTYTVLPPTPRLRLPANVKIACYDPKGITARLLRERHVPFQQLDTSEPPAGTTLFIIGREAISMNGTVLHIGDWLKRGMTILLFEQTEEVLQRYWGFRTASPGTRRVFVRQPQHPLCAGLNDELLRDWRGSSTLLEPYPQRTGYYDRYPRQIWCGFDNSRTWQWGNYGCVASVLIEKPQRGNWSFPLDCEFDLQYTPLCEWLAPQGRVIFCQIDLSGREGNDPVADRLLVNLLRYASTAPPPALSPASYIGNDATKELLTSLGVDLGGGSALLIGAGAEVTAAKKAMEQAKKVICLGLNGDELNAILPFHVSTETRTVTHTIIGRPTKGLLVGLGNSEFHWRGKVKLNAITEAGPLRVASTGVFAEGSAGGKEFVLVQFLPNYFDYGKKPYLKLSFRRACIALARILTNCGVRISSPLEERLSSFPPVSVDLTGVWKFLPDPEGKLRAEDLSSPALELNGWREIKAPGLWESQFEDLKDYNGVAWFRRTFELPRGEIPSNLTLRLGAIDDEDWTYLNGRLIGHIGQETHPDNYWAAPREYRLSPEDLHSGENILVVKVNDLRGGGGIAGGPVGVFEPGRWLDSYYLDLPTALDDPYRYNRW